MKSVLLPKKARKEIESALQFYAGAKAGLDDDLHAELVEVIESIQRTPLAYPLYEGTHARVAVLKEFPFSIIYLDRAADVLILALAHHRRRPGYWRRRLRDNNGGRAD